MAFTWKIPNEDTSELERDDFIISDEFGRTDCPNWIVDDFRYIEEERKSIYDITTGLYMSKNRVVYQNREVQKRNAEHTRRVEILHELIGINVHNISKCKNYIKYRRYLRNITIKRLKIVCHYFLSWQTTPTRQTSKDWKKVCGLEYNKKYIDIMYQILGM